LADANHNFKCKFCSKTHSTLKDLCRDLICEEALEDNLTLLADHEAKRLISISNDAKELFSGSQNAVEGLFEFYRYEIELKFESVRAALDKAACDLVKKVELDLSQNFDIIQNEFKYLKNKKSIDRSISDSEEIAIKLSNIGNRTV